MTLIAAGRKPRQSPTPRLGDSPVIIHNPAAMEFSFILPDDKEFDVVGFGLNAVDHLVTIPRFPSFNTKVRLSDHRQMSGGQVSSAMVGARRLGLRASYIGKVGYDNEGRMLIESLQKEGV